MVGRWSQFFQRFICPSLSFFKNILKLIISFQNPVRKYIDGFIKVSQIILAYILCEILQFCISPQIIEQTKSQNKINLQKRKTPMLLSNRSGNSSANSARLSRLTNHKFETISNYNLGASKKTSSAFNMPKIQFRKVLKSKNSHSRLADDDRQLEEKLIESRFSKHRTISHENSLIMQNNSNKNKKEIILNKNPTLQKSFHTLIPPESNQKYSITQKFLNTTPNLNRQSQKKFHAYPTEAMKIDSQEDQYKKKAQIVRKLRPQSSRFSSKKLIPYQRKMSQLENLTLSQQINHSQKKISSNHDSLELQALITKFMVIQQKINSLIAEKWAFIEEKIINQKQLLNPINWKSQLNDSKGKKSYLQNIKNSPNQKQDLNSLQSIAVQKNFDKQIMNKIKNLRNLNLTLNCKSQHNIKQNQIKNILNDLDNRRSQIIQRVLAESMVESDLLKKYYSGVNAKGISTSNYKVGQNSIKQKILLLGRNKGEQKLALQIPKNFKSLPRQNLVTSSESKANFVQHKEEDFEKYRYKQPDFKLNLQPLPRSSYNSDFFNYSNIRFSNPVYKQENSIIFPTSSNTLKQSCYKNEYRQFSPQKINYKELDAYQDKFKQINIMYIPKKSSDSEANSWRKTNKTGPYLNQIDFVKKLKTDSVLGGQKQRQLKQKSGACKFSTQTRDNYHNPQKLLQHFEKSKIKHKNLYLLKYEMKKKFHI